MSEFSTQSRPYAEAIFEIAKDDRALDDWSENLVQVVEAMAEDSVKALINSPDLSQKKKTEVFISLFEGEISKKTASFIQVLGQANRLNLLPSILEGFRSLVAIERNEKSVVVASSYNLEEDQMNKIKEALQKRTGATINLTTAIDKTLIGGIKISYEDQVIDLSLKNKLEALKAQLRN
jgi:F-type H+-transporting ATPase subunit delta